MNEPDFVLHTNKRIVLNIEVKAQNRRKLNNSKLQTIVATICCAHNNYVNRPSGQPYNPLHFALLIHSTTFYLFAILISEQYLLQLTTDCQLTAEVCLICHIHL